MKYDITPEDIGTIIAVLRDDAQRWSDGSEIRRRSLEIAEMLDRQWRTHIARIHAEQAANRVTAADAVNAYHYLLTGEVPS